MQKAVQKSINIYSTTVSVLIYICDTMHVNCETTRRTVLASMCYYTTNSLRSLAACYTIHNV